MLSSTSRSIQQIISSSLFLTPSIDGHTGSRGRRGGRSGSPEPSPSPAPERRRQAKQLRPEDVEHSHQQQRFPQQQARPDTCPLPSGVGPRAQSFSGFGHVDRRVRSAGLARDCPSRWPKRQAEENGDVHANTSLSSRRETAQRGREQLLTPEPVHRTDRDTSTRKQAPSNITSNHPTSDLSRGDLDPAALGEDRAGRRADDRPPRDHQGSTPSPAQQGSSSADADQGRQFRAGPGCSSRWCPARRAVGAISPIPGPPRSSTDRRSYQFPIRTNLRLSVARLGSSIEVSTTRIVAGIDARDQCDDVALQASTAGLSSLSVRQLRVRST